MSSQNTKPDTNVYRVRRDTRLPQALFLSKIIIKKHGSVQIEGVGESISLVAKLSQILSKDGFVTVEGLATENIGEGKSINPKLVARLSKTNRFDELTKSIVLRWSIALFTWCCIPYVTSKISCGRRHSFCHWTPPLCSSFDSYSSSSAITSISFEHCPLFSCFAASN